MGIMFYVLKDVRLKLQRKTIPLDCYVIYDQQMTLGFQITGGEGVGVGKFSKMK